MTDDFFRFRLEGIIDARLPLTVLGDKLPWSKLEASIAPIFAKNVGCSKKIQSKELETLQMWLERATRIHP